MTIKQIAAIYGKKIDPKEIYFIIAHVLKKDLAFVLAHTEKKLITNYPPSSRRFGTSTGKQITNYIRRRIKGEPLAYIFGQKEFYGLDFKVNKNVLVPRPETELMVEEVIKHITHNIKHATIVDVGTGSGCVIITLSNIINDKLPAFVPKIRNFGRQANCEFFGLDISAKALRIAKQNAKAHGLSKKIKFLRGHLLSPLAAYFKNIQKKYPKNPKNPKNLKNPKNPNDPNDPILHQFSPGSPFPRLARLGSAGDDEKKYPKDPKNPNDLKDPNIIITANLPYLDSGWKNLLKSTETRGLKFEPPIALYAGKDGLDAYRRLAGQIKILKEKTSRPITAFCEIGHKQAASMKKIFSFAAKIEIKKDLSGHDRLAIINC